MLYDLQNHSKATKNHQKNTATQPTTNQKKAERKKERKDTERKANKSGTCLRMLTLDDLKRVMGGMRFRGCR